MKNLNHIKKYFSTNDISFLTYFDRTINIDKSGRAYDFKTFRIELDNITNFIINLDENEIYLIDPVISINCRDSDPCVTLSRQFLVTNQSNPILINNYLIDQFGKFRADFGFHDGYYFLIFKYKSVKLDYRISE